MHLRDWNQGLAVTVGAVRPWIQGLMEQVNKLICKSLVSDIIRSSLSARGPGSMRGLTTTCKSKLTKPKQNWNFLNNFSFFMKSFLFVSFAHSFDNFGKTSSRRCDRFIYLQNHQNIGYPRNFEAVLNISDVLNVLEHFETFWNVLKPFEHIGKFF